MFNEAVLTDVKRKAVLEKRTKNRHVKKEWEHVSSKSSGSTKLRGGGGGCRAWNNMAQVGYGGWKQTNALNATESESDTRFQNQLQASDVHQRMCSRWRVCFLCELSWIRFSTGRGPPPVIHTQRLAYDHLLIGFRSRTSGTIGAQEKWIWSQCGEKLHFAFGKKILWTLAVAN